jgi:hypothetical protein
MEYLDKWAKHWWWVLLIPMLLWASGVGAQGAGVSPAPGIQLQDEGTGQGRITILNCVGAGVACTKSGTTGTATIAGGSGSFALTQIEIDFGSNGQFVHIETITDAAVTATSKLVFNQSGIAATGRQADENEMDGIVCTATPGTGNFVIQCRNDRSVSHGKFKVEYTIG